MTKRNESYKNGISQSFGTIAFLCGYRDEGNNSVSDQPDVALKLGQALFNYLTASTMDSDWEGFSTQELRGIEAFMNDLKRFVESK